jgi:hypothetical protein
MNAQLQQRAVEVAGRLSGITRTTNKRVLLVQQAVLAERTEHEVKVARLFKNRLSRAKSGLRRLLAFANSRPIHGLVKTIEQMGERGLLLDENRWNFIGTNATSRITIFIGVRGVKIVMVKHCHISYEVSAVFLYKGQKTTVCKIGNKSGEWSAPAEEILHRMAVGTMSPFNEVSEESEAAFRLLALWSRSAPFEKAAVAFLEKLEREAIWQFLKGM